MGMPDGMCSSLVKPASFAPGVMSNALALEGPGLEFDAPPGTDRHRPDFCVQYCTDSCIWIRYRLARLGFQLCVLERLWAHPELKLVVEETHAPIGSVGHPRRSALAAVDKLFRTSLGDEPWRRTPPRVDPRAVRCGASVDHARANASRRRAISSCCCLISASRSSGGVDGVRSSGTLSLCQKVQLSLCKSEVLDLGRSRAETR